MNAVFDSKMYCFRGDLTDVLAKTRSLVLRCSSLKCMQVLYGVEPHLGEVLYTVAYFSKVNATLSGYFGSTSSV